MLLYVFTIWLVSLYSSLGAPAPNPVPLEPTTNTKNATNQTITLSALANSCENPFLSAQIKSKIPDCPELNAPSSEQQFQCMLFYDINRQLCAAVASSKLALNVETPQVYTDKIEAPQDISELCKAARGWTYTDLGEIYKRNVKLVFEDVIRCSKTCSADYTNILNMDSNFYCKYFKWGTEILKSQVPTEPQTGVAVAENPEHTVSGNKIVTDVKSLVPKPEVPASVTLPGSEPQLKESLKTGNDPIVPPKVQSQPPGLTQKSNAEAQLPGNNVASKSTLEKPSSTQKEAEENNIEHSIVDPLEEAPADDVKDKTVDNKEAVDISGISGGDQANDAPMKGVVEAPKLSNVPSEIKTAIVEDKVPKAQGDTKVVNEQIQLPNDIEGEDYQSEIGSDQDGQGADDGEEDLGVPNPQDLDLNKNTRNKIEPQISNDSQKEYYPNGDSYSEEDDHFFPFFLTAIIMIVLLYILYHNKSKVSKVIMGLIVEGRQPGRRRNSRGHAYKRLDTLEQAMSANTAAPPSKIIY